MRFVVKDRLLKYPGPGGWRFVRLSKATSARIRKTSTQHRISKKTGWGYVPVKASIGKSEWRTGLWPKPDAGIFLLVVTAAVRKKERLFDGEPVQATITLPV